MKSPTALRLLVVLALGISVLSACAPAPSPSPTPSPAFTSEEDAFAAAEATFAAYIDASNATNLDTPSTFEPLFSWLTEDALTSAKENFSEFHAQGWSRTGDTTFDHFRTISFGSDVVVSEVCVDVSQVTLTDKEGNAVNSDRPDRQPIQVQMSPTTETATGLAIASTSASGDLSC